LPECEVASVESEEEQYENYPAYANANGPATFGPNDLMFQT
jgi:hypothetical protein